MCGRVVDLVTPIGRGQRCLIVAPPKTGKTTLLKRMAQAVSRSIDPDVELMVLLDRRAARKKSPTCAGPCRGDGASRLRPPTSPPQNHVAVAEIVAGARPAPRRMR